METVKTPVVGRAGSWYALAVIAGQEPKIRERIHDRLDRVKIESSKLTIVAPSEEVAVYSAAEGTREIKSRLSLPGYLLIHCPGRAINPEVLTEIVRVKGVIEFLGGDHPTSMRGAEVERMLGQEGKGSEDRSLSPFNVGDSVRVVTGPLAGFTAEILETNDGRGEAKIEVEIFGRTTPTTVPFRQLTPA